MAEVHAPAQLPRLVPPHQLEQIQVPLAHALDHDRAELRDDVVECYYKCPFWPNLVKEFEKVLISAVFWHTL